MRCATPILIARNLFLYTFVCVAPGMLWPCTHSYVRRTEDGNGGDAHYGGCDYAAQQ